MKKLLAILLCLCESSWAASWTKNQLGQTAAWSSGNTIIVTFGSAIPSGDVVIVGISSFDGTSTPPTITIKDGNSNNYTATPASPSNTNPTTAGNAWIFYLVAPSNANTTLTATYSSNPSAGEMWADDFTPTGGTGSLDTDAAGNGSATTTANTPTITVNQANTLLYSFVSNGSNVTAIGGSWVEGGSQPTLPTNGGNGAAYILAASANTAVNMTLQASTSYDSMGAAFKITSAVTGRGYNKRKALELRDE